MNRKSPFYKGFFIGYNIFVNNQLQLFQGYTLVDITPTGQIVYEQDKELERNQQRNWETIQQILSLRTQPNIIHTTSLVDELTNFQFGINYQGQHRVWMFTFGVEYKDIYTLGSDVFGHLRSDFKMIPVITGLAETAKFPQPIFYTSGPDNNIYFKTLV